jgi:predicted Zn-ribbon and HTH transcriptional regulator
MYQGCMSNLNLKKINVKGYLAKCDKCGYEWIYTRGIPKYWISCPKCKSKKNNINHEIFGKWHPEVSKK